MEISGNGSDVRLDRRRFLKLSSFAAAVAADGLPLFHLREDASAAAASGRNPARLGNWQDLYRQRWSWDFVAKGTHGWLNCRSACNFDLYVKNGIVVREDWMRVFQFLGLRWGSVTLPPDHLAPGCEVFATAIGRDDGVMVGELLDRNLLPWCQRARERLESQGGAISALVCRFEADLRKFAAPGRAIAAS